MPHIMVTTTNYPSGLVIERIPNVEIQIGS